MVSASCFCGSVFAQEDLSDADEQIIQYHAKNGLEDPVARLQKRLAEGKATLKFETNGGYLPDLLRALHVPISSQGLVFSKTSSQGEQCNPQTPRAVFFADDIYVGWVPGGPVIDLAAVDPRRGPIFYTLEQRPGGAPKFTRPETCMQCHLGPKTLNVPGLVVRSVYTAANGKPLAQVDTFVNGHNSALEQRWGGWYVSGTHAGALHLGNTFVTNSAGRQDWLDGQPSLPMSAGGNVTDLRDRFDTARYLSRHSDIVALLVLEHEVRMQNLITRASYETRLALEERKQNGSEAPGSSASRSQVLVSNWPQERIALAGEMLLEYLLFRNEAPLKGAVKGTSSFADDFQSRGPTDLKGRSLRQLNLATRLFRYPCSFLIYSRAFDALPSEMKTYLWQRLEQILTAKDQSAACVGMSAEDRQAVWEILRETKSEFAAWLSSSQRHEIK